MLKIIRPCPLCSGKVAKDAYPYAISYEGECYNYHKCEKCNCVFVDPVPSLFTLAKMYGKSEYHDLHYHDCQGGHYKEAVTLLKRHAQAGARIMDYGCGVGNFLRETKLAGFEPVGVEFDAEAAKFAAQNAGCSVYTLSEFPSHLHDAKFDVIHMGDVLEHLENPATTMSGLLPHLEAGGLLFVEGPLENNPSPVYWASSFFGTVKHILKPRPIGFGMPTHLFRASGSQQMAFFQKTVPRLKLLSWEIYETGWPYANNGPLKNLISKFACVLGGVKFRGVVFGNRFRAIFQHPGGC